MPRLEHAQAAVTDVVLVGLELRALALVLHAPAPAETRGLEVLPVIDAVMVADILVQCLEDAITGSTALAGEPPADLPEVR